MFEVNKCIRAERRGQVAFARKIYEELPVVQDILDASNDENVAEMNHAMEQIFRHQCKSYIRDFPLE